MAELADSKLFTPWADPETGVTVYIMTEKVAPVQQSFYFVNEGLSGDGRYLWFYCAFPPSGSNASGRTLGVADSLGCRRIHRLGRLAIQRSASSRRASYVDGNGADSRRERTPGVGGLRGAAYGDSDRRVTGDPCRDRRSPMVQF